MEETQEFVEGSLRVQVLLVVLLLLGVGLFWVLAQQIETIIWEIDQVAARYPDVALAMGNRLLLWMLVFSGSLALAVALYLQVLARRVGRQGRYPPEGMPLAFRTRVLRGRAARLQQRLLQLLTLLLWLYLALGLAFWYWLSGGQI